MESNKCDNYIHVWQYRTLLIYEQDLGLLLKFHSHSRSHSTVEQLKIGFTYRFVRGLFPHITMYYPQLEITFTNSEKGSL